MRIGEFNSLRIDRFTSVGAYLVDNEGNDVLLPNKYLTEELEVDSEINVFIYRDSEDRLVATTETPAIRLGGFAYLTIKDVNFFGAFADWGLEKDLLIPFKEQMKKLEEGKRYLVSLQYDESTDRLYGTTKIRKHLLECHSELIENDAVDLLVWESSDLGLKVIVNDRYSGLIYHNDLHKDLRQGETIKGFVAKVREDGKLDIRLDPAGYEKVGSASDILLAALTKEGKLYLNDKSDPDAIKEALGMSKKTFKQAVGKLYKERKLNILPDGIELVP